jgi:prepilin-type N-terminal cleavage/methylation domain-containing protein
MKCSRSGFTLSEFLVVVTLVAILSAIMVPNFLESQIRSKVSRVKSDLRNLATAFEAYRVDHGSYPIHRAYGSSPSVFIDLTAPVAYLATSTTDPFHPVGGDALWGKDYYWGTLVPHLADWTPNRPGYDPNIWCSTWACEPGSEAEQKWLKEAELGREFALNSAGPNRVLLEEYFEYIVYDPSNGTVSKGNIFHLGP